MEGARSRRAQAAFEARVRAITGASVGPRFAAASHAASTLAATAALLVLTTVPWIGGDRFTGGLRAWDLPEVGVAGTVVLVLALERAAHAAALARA